MNEPKSLIPAPGSDPESGARPRAFALPSMPASQNGHAELVEERFDERRFMRWGWWLVLLGFVGFIVWAALAPLDQGTPVTGTVVVGGNRKVVQHPSGGIIDDIVVHEGSEVKEGDVLVRMNETNARSESAVLKTTQMSLMAVHARLAAERDAGVPQWPTELKSRMQEPAVKAAVELQQKLFETRRRALASDMDAYEAAIRGIQAQLQSLQESRRNRQLQRTSLEAQLTDMRDLAKDGYVPRNRLLELERQYAQIAAALSDDSGVEGRLLNQVAEQRMRASQRREEYQKEVRSQLTDVERDLLTTQARLEAADFQLANATVRAPASGIVVGVNVFTRGGVVSAGQKLMDVVPQDEPLEVEGELPVHLVDKVHPGMPVELAFPALNRVKTPSVPGELMVVSADRLVNEATQQPFYRVRAKVTPEGVKMLHDQQIRAGMPAEIFVISGERTFFNYLIKPLRDRAARALTEE